MKRHAFLRLLPLIPLMAYKKKKKRLFVGIHPFCNKTFLSSITVRFSSCSKTPVFSSSLFFNFYVYVVSFSFEKFFRNTLFLGNVSMMKMPFVSPNACFYSFSYILFNCRLPFDLVFFDLTLTMRQISEKKTFFRR